MAGRETPTNDRAVALLQEVLRELKELEARQARIETGLEELARATR